MKKLIDDNGYFIEDVITEETSNNLIEIPCPGGFYKPRWNGTSWVEGLTQAEIDAIKNQPIAPSESDRLSAVESAISALMGV